MNPKQLLIGFLWMLIANTSYSQLQRRYFTYNVENGLAQNSVWDIHQDHKGFLWIGTADGLNRFDGYEMYHYKHRTDDTTSIGGVTLFEFFEAPNKELWISHDKGISIYNRTKDCFENIFKSKYITKIIGVDSKNRVWAIEEQYRILIYDLKNHKLLKKINSSYLKDYSIYSAKNNIAIQHNFFTTLNSQAIIRIDTKADTIEYITTKDIGLYTYNFLKLSDSTFLSFNSNKESIYTFKYSNHRLTNVVKKVKKYSPNKQCSGLFLWNDKIYISTLEGFFIMNKQTYEIEEYVKNFNNNETSFNYIQHIDADKSSNLYICTNGMGMKMYSPYLNKFKHLRTKNESTNMVKSILKTKDGKIITGVYNEGLIVYYPNNTYKQFKYQPSYLHNNSFLSVLGMMNYTDDIILMMYSDRLELFNHQTNKLISFPKKQFFEFQFYPYFIKHKGEIHFCHNRSANSTISRIDKNFNYHSYYHTKKRSITCFAYLNDSLLLVGTDRNLVLHNLNKKKDTETKVNIMVKSICITKKGRIYVSTISGLYEIDKNASILRKYDVTSGMPDDFIYGVLEDKNGDLWLSHNKGLSVLNLKTNTFKNYSVKDGLQSNEFNTGAYYKDEEGLLYFGGVNGINIIDPDKIIKNYHAPQISINQINLFDEPYTTDTSYNEIKQLNLEYNQNTLSFDFSALEFTNPAFNTYKYILSGYDQQWIQSGTKHFARYSNLPPGSYRFMILAANADGVWTKEAKILLIHIQAPFWQTTFFYVLLGVLLLAIIGGIIYAILYRQKLKLNRQLKLQFELEQERLRIARDLHDNVGAHLSYLISNLDWMISHPEKLSLEEEKKRLENLTETGRQAILTLRQTIWAINNQALYIEDFADKYKAFAKKMLDFSQHISIHFEEEITAKRKLSPGITLHLFRICQEALSNILKHANAQNIHVLFRSNEEELFFFEIMDDGKGFDTSLDYSNDHFGLVIMQERAIECGAEFQLKSESGQGTKVSIRIK